MGRFPFSHITSFDVFEPPFIIFVRKMADDLILFEEACAEFDRVKDDLHELNQLFKAKFKELESCSELAKEMELAVRKAIIKTAVKETVDPTEAGNPPLKEARDNILAVGLYAKTQDVMNRYNIVVGFMGLLAGTKPFDS